MVFHASLLKKYVYDTKHVIDWSLLQVELEGESVPEPLHILDKREVQLRKRTMREAYTSLFHDFILSP